MSDNLKLALDDDGNVVCITETTTSIQAPLDEDELLRQINEHADIMNTLQAQLQAVQSFKASKLQSDTVAVTAQFDNPIVNQDAIDAITPTAEVEDATLDAPVETKLSEEKTDAN